MMYQVSNLTVTEREKKESNNFPINLKAAVSPTQLTNRPARLP